MNEKAIGIRLNNHRLKKNKSLQEVAEAVGITVSALSNYENGARIPRDEIKVRLADYYKTTVQALFYAD